LKGYLNLNPSEEDMHYWAERQKLSLDQTISFTDGSKLQVEQALTANGLQADIACDGLIGATVDNLAETGFYADIAKELCRPISDYVLCAGAPPGVLIIAEHAFAHERRGNVALNRLLTSDGKYFQLLRPHHLIFLEIVRTIADWRQGLPPLLNNTRLPRISVGAVTKKALNKDTLVERGLGSFSMRGMALQIIEHPNHVPICLIQHARLKTSVEAGQLLTFGEVEVPESDALSLYLNIRRSVLEAYLPQKHGA
jgi:predicted homoserine dehydrogenase-like protein